MQGGAKVPGRKSRDRWIGAGGSRPVFLHASWLPETFVRMEGQVGHQALRELGSKVVRIGPYLVEQIGL